MAIIQQGWLTKKQAAAYLGVSLRGMGYAIDLKKRNLANKTLELKEYGNRTLISKKSIDITEKIIIDEKKLAPQY